MTRKRLFIATNNRGDLVHANDYKRRLHATKGYRLGKAQVCPYEPFCIIPTAQALTVEWDAFWSS